MLEPFITEGDIIHAQERDHRGGHHTCPSPRSQRGSNIHAQELDHTGGVSYMLKNSITEEGKLNGKTIERQAHSHTSSNSSRPGTHCAYSKWGVMAVAGSKKKYRS